MKSAVKVFRYGEAGFTLIELLVVVSILAALAGVVTLGVTQFIGKGRAEACKTDLHNVQTATVACIADNNTCDDCNSVTELLSGGYILDEPLGDYTWDANCRVTQTTCPK